MNVNVFEVAPFLSANELLALSDPSLPFDAIALYIRGFCCHDKENHRPVNLSINTMSQLNGYVTNRGIKPLTRARVRTLIRHLERVGLIDKPTSKSLNDGPKFKRTYSRILSDGPTSITEFENSKLVGLSLSYEALCLYVRGIRPHVNIHTFKALVCSEIVSESLTLEPMVGSTEPYKKGSRLVREALSDLVNAGLVDYRRSGIDYVFTCYVSNAFDTNWLRNLGNKP